MESDHDFLNEELLRDPTRMEKLNLRMTAPPSSRTGSEHGNSRPENEDEVSSFSSSSNSRSVVSQNLIKNVPNLGVSKRGSKSDSSKSKDIEEVIETPKSPDKQPEKKVNKRSYKHRSKGSSKDSSEDSDIKNFQPFGVSLDMSASSKVPTSEKKRKVSPGPNKKSKITEEEPSPPLKPKIDSQKLAEFDIEIYNYLQRLEQELEEKNAIIAELKAHLEKTTNEHNAFIARARKQLQDTLIEAEKNNRRNRRNQILKDSVILGQIAYERQGASFNEVWKDGTAFIEIIERKKEIEIQWKELESKKKALNLRRKHTTNEAEHEEISLQEAILKIRSNALKQAQAELEEDKRKLVAQKNLLIKEIRRMNDEDSSQFNDFRILRDRYLLLQLLGKGGFSEVYRAYDLANFRHVACKIHQLNPHWPEKKRLNYTKHACREYNIHKSLDHARVVKLYDVFEIDSISFCTVLEYCSAGDLDSYLKKQGFLPEFEAKIIINQIFQGLKYLSEQKKPIIHYDLKPGNILFNEPGSIKIADFGLSKVMEEDTSSIDLTSQGAGTYWYLPPECFETEAPRISSKVDVWSAGVIFYQMLYGEKPFGNNLSQHKILQQGIIDKNVVVNFPPHKKVSQEAKEFIIKCLTPNQDKRADVHTLSNDPFLKFPTKKTGNALSKGTKS